MATTLGYEPAEVEGSPRTDLIHPDDVHLAMRRLSGSNRIHPYVCDHAAIRVVGGDISVTSQPGRGTTFSILLPASDQVVPAAYEGAPAAALPGRDETVLVVEDERPVRRLVERVLGGNGHRVLVAATGSEAIDVARESQRIDLLVTDVIMPQMSGVSVAEFIKNMHPNVKVLFMSGYPDDTVAQLGVRDGVEKFIQKPFTSEELLGKMRAALDSAPDSAAAL